MFQIIGCAIEVHSTLGCGLFESPYRKCLAREFELQRVVDRLLPIHDAQVITYLKPLQLRQGLLLNFNAELMKKGLKSIVI